MSVIELYKLHIKKICERNFSSVNSEEQYWKEVDVVLDWLSCEFVLVSFNEYEIEKIVEFTIKYLIKCYMKGKILWN